MTETQRPLFVDIAEYSRAVGVKSISQLEGCWEHEVDGRWKLYVNGHRDPIPCSTGTVVPAFSAYVTFNGWPAGILDPWGGVIAAGDAANADTFREALQMAAAQCPDAVESEESDA